MCLLLDSISRLRSSCRVSRLYESVQSLSACLLLGDTSADLTALVAKMLINIFLSACSASTHRLSNIVVLAILRHIAIADNIILLAIVVDQRQRVEVLAIEEVEATAS